MTWIGDKFNEPNKKVSNINDITETIAGVVIAFGGVLELDELQMEDLRGLIAFTYGLHKSLYEQEVKGNSNIRFAIIFGMASVLCTLLDHTEHTEGLTYAAIREFNRTVREKYKGYF
jgi:hypothetical protein